MGSVLALWENLTGAVIPFAGSAAPDGFLMCDGSVKGRSNYPNLFAIIGTTYNTGGETSGQFRLPDMRGRVAAGKDDMGGTAASRLTSLAASLGASGGAETHTLTTAQIPAHNHSLSDPGHAHGVSDPTHAHAVADPGHTHSHNALVQGQSSTTGGGSFGISSGVGAATINAAATGISIYASGTGVSVNAAGTGITIQDAGDGGAHPNVQPTLVLNYIIKT